MGFPCQWRSLSSSNLVPVHLVRISMLPSFETTMMTTATIAIMTTTFMLLKIATSNPRSVTPSLISWMALLVPSQSVATTICVAGLITALVSIHHQQFLRLEACSRAKWWENDPHQGRDLDQHGYPAWFRGLHLILTLVIIIIINTKQLNSSSPW